MDIRYLKGIIILFPSKKKIPRRPAMSNLSIAPYFPFRRIRITNETLIQGAAHIEVTPDRRFHPICHLCGQQSSSIHSWTERPVRDLNLASTRVWLFCQYRKIFCLHCQRIVTEDLGLFPPFFRATAVRRALMQGPEALMGENPGLYGVIFFFKELCGTFWGQLQRFMTPSGNYENFKPIFAR
jgi:hypothetical protein